MGSLANGAPVGPDHQGLGEIRRGRRDQDPQLRGQGDHGAVPTDGATSPDLAGRRPSPLNA